MKMAYATHNRALRKYKAAKTIMDKAIVAHEYFKNEAVHVNQAMKDKLKEE